MTGPATWDGDGIDPWLPHRLAAESAISQAELRLYNSWWGSFSSWLVGVRRSVLSGTTPDPSAVWAHAPAWAQTMTGFVSGPVKDTVGLAFDTLFGEGYAFDARPAVSTYLAAVHNRMVRTPDDVFDVVATSIARGAGQGLSIPDVAALVDHTLASSNVEQWQGRAVTVARTETIGALNFGRSDAFAAVAAELGDQFGEVLEQQWLCVAPDTPIVAAGIKAGARRHYKGPLIRVSTASGRSLTLTPEHRVLTGRGWLPAHAIDKGDNLVQVVGVEPAGTPQIQNVPPQLGELVDTAIAAEPIEVRTVPAAVDLDGQPLHGEIEVVSIDRDLAARIESRIPEGCEDLFLAHADGLGPVDMLAPGDPLTGELGHGPTDRGGAGRLDASPFAKQGLGIGLGGPDTASYGLVAKGNAGTDENPRDHGGSAVVGLGHAQNAVARKVFSHDRGPVDIVASVRLSGETLGRTGLLDGLGPGEPSPDRLGLGEQNPALGQPTPDRNGAGGHGLGDFTRRFAGLVAADKVVHVEVVDWDSHVYDLSTGSEWFAADGLIIHNSTLDNRTREDHAAADGQRVPVGTAFDVGGEPLMFPGDPAGSAAQTINCRCTTLLVRPGEELDMTGRGFTDADEWWAEQLAEAA